MMKLRQLLTNSEENLESIAKEMGVGHATTKVYSSKLFNLLGLKNGRISLLRARIVELEDRVARLEER